MGVSKQALPWAPSMLAAKSADQTASEAWEVEHKQINRQITIAAETGNLEFVLQVVQKHLDHMNLINFSTAIHRIAKLALSCSMQVRERICQHATMRALQTALVEHVQQALSQQKTGNGLGHQERQSEMRCLSIICWSCAMLRIREESLMEQIARASSKRLGELKPFELSNMLWAFAKLNVGSKLFHDGLTQHLLQRKDGQYGPQCLSTIVWAFGTVKVHQPQVFKSFARELAQGASSMAPQGIANTAWAFARVRRQEAPLFQALAEAATQRGVLWTFKPQELSNLVWAFATVGLPNEGLFAKIMEVAIKWRRDLSPQNVANMLWAYAKLGATTRGQLFTSLLEVAANRLEQYKPQEISAILWAASKEVHHNPTCQHFFKVVPGHFAHRLQEFTPQALACMLEAFTVAEIGNDEFFDAMEVECLGRLPSFQPPSLCTLMRGIVLKAQPDENKQMHYLQTVASHVSSRLGQLQPHNLLHLVQTLDLLQDTSNRAIHALVNHPVIAALQEKRHSSSTFPVLAAQLQAQERAEIYEPSSGGELADDDIEIPHAPAATDFPRESWPLQPTVSHPAATAKSGRTANCRRRLKKKCEVIPSPVVVAFEPACSPASKSVQENIAALTAKENVAFTLLKDPMWLPPPILSMATSMDFKQETRGPGLEWSLWSSKIEV